MFNKEKQYKFINYYLHVMNFFKLTIKTFSPVTCVHFHVIAIAFLHIHVHTCKCILS